MKVAVLVSGGVDSSVALRLVLREGHEVIAFYLKIWLEDELSYLGDCPWEQDLAYARQVCDQAGVELRVISLQKEYHDKVVAYALDTIAQGGTPNPDIMCNTFIKFGAFYDAVGKEFDAIATGHYAQVVQENGCFYLERTPDAIKDQTYFLAQLRQDQLACAMFPIGKYTKQEVRQLAQSFDLCNKDRKDSQGLCFLGKIKFHDFIKHHMGCRQGDFIEYETGKKLGTHNGYWFYTIGQRQGIGLSHGPWYVVKKDSVNNIIYISSHYYADDKLRDICALDMPYWFSGNAPLKESLQVKLRHGPHFIACSISEDAHCGLLLTLKEHDQGIATGQFAVFYKDNRCLGSARIRALDK